MVLVCRCGQKLNTPGAVPGRVGKCPRCGSLLTIAAVDPPDPPAGSPDLSPPARRPPATRNPLAARKAVRKDGLVVVPTTPETTLWGSCNYPFRGVAGLGLLAMLPPLLCFATAGAIMVLSFVMSALPVSLLGLILLVPSLLFFFAVLGHVLVFLGDVIVTSCLGAVDLPRSATWSLTDIGAAWGRWLWAGLAGGVIGGAPALLYWVRCGDVDWFDRVVLIDLILPGLAYAQMAVVLAWMHESPWAVAYPVIVFRAIVRGGWGYLGPCLVSGVSLLVAGSLLLACLEIAMPVVQIVALWLWWVLTLYLAMVVFRCLGLFCARRRLLGAGVERRR